MAADFGYVRLRLAGRACRRGGPFAGHRAGRQPAPILEAREAGVWTGGRGGFGGGSRRQLGGLPMALAVGTSLLVIAMQSTSGLAAHLVTVSLDWPVVLMVTSAAVVGSFLGAAMVGRVPERSQRKGFGVFVLLMGVVVLVQEVPRLVGG